VAVVTRWPPTTAPQPDVAQIRRLSGWRALPAGGTYRPVAEAPECGGIGGRLVAPTTTYCSTRTGLEALSFAHAKRIASLADATLGVMHTASLAVCMARRLNARHAVKQVDRMLPTQGIDVDQILALWVPFVIGARTSLLVAMDWTDFDTDKQAA
jgi:hypothetical protein